MVQRDFTLIILEIGTTSKMMFKKFWAIGNRGYTSKVRLRGLTQNQTL